MERGIRFIGNGQAPVHLYWEELLKKIQSGEIDPLRMLTHRIKMEDMDKCYYTFDKKEVRAPPSQFHALTIQSLTMVTGRHAKGLRTDTLLAARV